VPSNAQRRNAAKRKLERQLEHRAERERRRRRMTIALSALGVVVVVAAAAALWSITGSEDDTATDASAAETTAETDSEYPALPAGRSEPLPETVNCEYPADGSEPAKPVEAPRTEGIMTTGENNTDISVSVETTQGNIGLILHNSDSPCTVNNFLSLASQGYFDDTTCHRLTTSPSLRVLQCGDPTGTGTGGPGYGFANEFPTDQYAADDPASQEPVVYPRGTVAMANTGQPGSNGSQFFLVYGDSVLPPLYTVFGTIDETGLTTLDKIAEAGVSGGAADGAPGAATTLTSVRMD